MNERVHFNQYLRPDGQVKGIYIERPKEVAEKAQRLWDAGYELTAEVLPGNLVSFCIADADEDLATEIALNGPEVFEAVDRLVMEFKL